MCVIMIVDEKRPTQEMVEKAWDWNNDFGGVAYRDGKHVVWKKGIQDFDEMEDLIESLPMPFIAHFRIASSGAVRPELCHPFPIDHKASLALEGRTTGEVLFHNGTWKGYEEICRYAAVMSGVKLPVGKWNDTRAMAWLCSIYGEGYMEFLPEQRGVAFGVETLNVFTGPGWDLIDGVWCSNKVFMDKGQRRHMWNLPMCGDSKCTNKFNLDSDGRCPTHPLRGRTIHLTAGPQGVSSTPVTPFTPMISLEEAELLWGADKISRNLMKAIRKAYERYNGVDQKEANRAKKALQALTSNLNSRGLRA